MPKKYILYGLAGLVVLVLLTAFIYKGGPGMLFAERDNAPGSGQGTQNPSREGPRVSPEEQARIAGANELGRVPVLVYHKIGDESGRWTRTPENFRKDLQELYSRGYVLVSLTNYLKGEMDIPQGKSPAVITFDDSTPGHFRLVEDSESQKLKVDPDCAVGILKDFGEKHPEFGHTATFFINARPFSGEKGQENLWQKKLQMLKKWGFEIGNHTYTHQNLSGLTPEEVQNEIAMLKEHVQKALPGYKPRVMAIVQDGVPEQYKLLAEGKKGETKYKHLGVVRWAWRDALSPYHKDFDPYHVQRIQVYQDHGVSSLVNWLNRIEPRRYVSDGNAEYISLPESWASVLPGNPPGEVVTYTIDNPERTPAKEKQADNARGVHVTFSYASSPERWEKILSLVEKTQLNAVQLDIKDESGYVGYDTSVKLAREIGAAKDYMPVREMLKDLRDRGIYSVARIVVSRDPVLAKKKPRYMVKKKNGVPLGNGVWVNPRVHDVWEYNVNLAREAYAMGFDEVQFDYIRFPEGKDAWNANYGTENTRSRVEVITDFFRYARSELGWEKRISAAVFGFIGFASDDMNIGQRPERLGPYLDYLSPMVYPSHYSPGNYGYSNPNAHPFGVVDGSLKDFKGLLENTGCKLRPWLQAFSLGPPAYGRKEIQAQVKATNQNGINTWLLWNAGVYYDAEEIK